MNKRKLKEFLGDYSMAGATRFDSPGNIRHGQPVRGDRAPHLETPEEAGTPKSAVVYLKKDGKVLAVSRGADMSDMNMPGGGVELGEDSKDAAVRELWEETGIIAHELFPVFSKKTRGKLVTTYKVVSYGGKLRPSREGAPEWVSPEVLKQSTYGDYFQEMLDSLVGDALEESKKI